MILRQEVEHHSILVRRRINRGDPARTVRVVQHSLDLLRAYFQPRRFVAVDLHVELRILQLKVADHIRQGWNCGGILLQLARCGIEFCSIRTLQRVLVLSRCRISADPHRWRILHIDPHEREAGQLLPHTADDDIDFVPLSTGLETQEEKAKI